MVNNTMKIYVSISVFFFLTTVLNAQVNDKKVSQFEKIDSLMMLDYFNINYKYIDRNYNICIDSNKFNKTVFKFNFYNERIKNNKDSLFVALMAEFEDFDQARIACNRITFKWERLTYYLWLSTDEVKTYALENGYKHPYEMFYYLYYDKTKSKSKDEIIDRLRNRLCTFIDDNKIYEFDNKTLLNTAFNNHPKVLKSLSYHNHNHKKN